MLSRTPKKHLKDRRKEKSDPSMEYPVLTVNQAYADGWTPSGLRALANSLERIAKYGYSGELLYEEGMPGDNVVISRANYPSYNPRKTFQVSRRLRQIAKIMSDGMKGEE
jgi:hypothetical protein